MVLKHMADFKLTLCFFGWVGGWD